jgi:hypothetical protein
VNENAYRARAKRQGRLDSVETVREVIAMGATIVNFSSETAVLRAGYANAVAEIRRAPAAGG